MRTRASSRCPLILGALLPFVLVAPTVLAQDANPPADSDAMQQQSAEPGQPGSPIEYPPPRKTLAGRTLGDAEAYFTAPLHWNGRNWAFFGGALATIAIAHHYDTQARTHFVGSSTSLGPKESGQLKDALPGAALFLGTWGYAALIDSNAGKSEAWNMLESGGLSFITAYSLKYIVRRQGPADTTDPNRWFKSGGASFPSEHTTAAFAVGTILAESGNPEFRWLRRTIGYGVGFGTAYLRMKHNAHWLSDTIAGAALGAATAHFVMNRSTQREDEEGTEMSLVPVQGGVMLAFSTNLPN
jgi:membrane-associated phospholipid phosphatase